jgi:hypothetical protein
VEQEYLDQLKELLFKLKNNEGHFIIQEGHFDIKKNNGNEVFCQLMKNDKKDPIRFEALSHHFDISVDKKLKSRFSALGFTLKNQENYAKNIFLNSEVDINNTASEIVKIFEEIYQIDKQSAYDFDDQIKVIENKSKKIQSANHTDNVIVPTPLTPKISGWRWLVLIIIVLVGYFAFFDKDNNKKSSSDETIVNSEWDASVYQVVDYLKSKYLNDPDSYQSISWSEVFKLNDTKEVGFASYQVRHKYRAKNEYGGYITEEKLFKLDYQGNVVDVRDYPR